MNRLLGILTVLFALAAHCAPAGAQAAFPQKTVTLIVPLAPGGGTDIVARKLAQALQALWGHNVIVENVAGASSILGAQKVARATPDGHTLLVTTNGAIVGNRFLFKSLPYDPDRDFIPIAQLADIEMVVLANNSLAANNLAELVALRDIDGDGAARRANLARVRILAAGEHAQQRRLASAVRADHADPLAFINRDRNAAEEFAQAV